MFYPSEYFEAHREEYIDSLNALHQAPTAGDSNPFLKLNTKYDGKVYDNRKAANEAVKEAKRLYIKKL